MKIINAFLFLTAIAAANAWGADEARLGLGKKIFDANCQTCHETGKPKNDAPQLFEKDEWKARLGSREQMYKNAIDGVQGDFTMPAKGGNMALTDDEVKAAVDYILDRAGIR